MSEFLDEINPNIYEQFVKRHPDTSSDSKLPEKEGNLEEEGENKTSQYDGGQNDQIPDKSHNTREIVLVDWYGKDDPENPQNWPSSRKLLVTFQICILNFGIYIGSSIYTPGELSVMEEFGASEIVATLGLSLFVLYAFLNPTKFH
ncbi:hypothetical protein CDV31_012929 [Fusarium ambrosium]|uniref:Major facilitator superfamily (MFS) profile domain-containing protein n=1 Tax=Fusarium ambrosium TaxID=131363 RepID=A0A428T6I3_9HYPO|nr:hypothetical protein CDV31_012929 [Fusarium ambrosium]